MVLDPHFPALMMPLQPPVHPFSDPDGRAGGRTAQKPLAAERSLTQRVPLAVDRSSIAPCRTSARIDGR